MSISGMNMDRNVASATHKTLSRRKDDIKKYMKNKWRQETFNKKLKVEKWEEQRQKTALRKYYKQLRKDGSGRNYVHPADKRRKYQSHEAKTFVVSTQNETTTSSSQPYDRDSNILSSKKQKPSAFKRALETFEKKQLERETEKEIREQHLKQKQEKLKQYKNKRTENFKKISLKTSRGQPVMAGRIHMLLSKIEKNVCGATVR